MTRARDWLNRPFNVRHWALRVLSRGAPTLINGRFENGSLIVDGDHAYVHVVSIKQPPCIDVRGSKATISNTTFEGGVGLRMDGG